MKNIKDTAGFEKKFGLNNYLYDPELKNYTSCSEELKSFIFQDRQEVLELVEKELSKLEFDAEAHAKGRCSFSSVALCSAFEHDVKNQIRRIIEDLKK